MTRHTRVTIGIVVGALAAGAVAVATPAAGKTNDSGRGQIVAVQPLRPLADRPVRGGAGRPRRHLHGLDATGTGAARGGRRRRADPPRPRHHLPGSLRRPGVAAPVVDAGDLVHNGSKHLGANIMGTADTVKWFKTL